MLNMFTVKANDFLKIDVKGFYRTDYLGYKKPNNPDYLNTFKNTFDNISLTQLNSSLEILNKNMINELNYIYENINIENEILYICIVPRAKQLNNYSNNQLLFRNYFKSLLQPRTLERLLLLRRFGDGIDFIIRTQNTRTTHLSRSNIANDGSMPYVGITKDTCKLSTDIKDKHILLIDDIYTKNVNIDEDALQALLDFGAKSVTLFVIAKTRNLEINF